MSEKHKEPRRAELLKQLREEHHETVERTKALLKTQKEIRRQICQATREAPKSVPEIAEATGLPAGDILWYLTAMRKYGDVIETGMCGEYYLYQRVEEAKK